MDAADPVSPPQLRLTTRGVLLAGSAVAMGMSLHLTDGLYSPGGVALMTLSLLACMVAIMIPARSVGEVPTPRSALLLGAMALFQLLAMPLKVAGASAATVPVVSQLPYHIGLLVAFVAVLMIMLAPARLATIGFIVLLTSHAAIGIWKIRTAPEPRIDVFLFQRAAGEALGHGANPYRLTFPNIHGREDIYAPGTIKDGQLQFGYPYPPLTLLLTAPVQWIFGDFRYAMLVAVLASGVMLARIGGGRTGMLIGALLLFTPRCFYVIEMAWTEPLCVMLLVAMIVTWRRSVVLAAVIFGLVLASKQYLPFMVLLVPLLFPTGAEHAKLRRFVFIGIVVAVLVSLPLAVWDWLAFWRSAVTLQLHQPYRPDSTSLLAWWGSGRPGWVGPFWLAFVALFAGVSLSYCQPRRGMVAFVGAFSMSLFLFLAFNKQAFANYYFLVIAALCATAALEVRSSTASESADNTNANPATSAPAPSPA